MTRALVLLCALASVADANEHLDDRFTATAGFGVLWMQIDGITNHGMALQPTFNRAFDRFELQADYLIADVNVDAMPRVGSVLHRLGFSARHQLGRVRVDGQMTLDLIVEAGIGLQYLSRDDGSAIGRSDFVVGLGLRTLMNLTNDRKKRALMGIDGLARMIATPSGDVAFLAVFGVPFGR